FRSSGIGMGIPKGGQIMIHAGGWCRKPALMTRALSLDLRHRIIRAVAEEGMSRRGAATRFGVAPSTVVEFMRQWKATGSCEARPQGGDRRSARIEAHSAQLLALVEA